MATSAPKNGTIVPNDSARNIVRINALQEIPLDWIQPSPLNPRKEIDPQALDELAASIKAHGIIEPLVIRTLEPATDEASYELIAGERRWRAARIAGLKTAPARIMGHIDDAAAVQMMLVENLQRADLSPIDEARGYQDLHDRCGMTQAQIAAATGRSQPAVANRMRLLNLPADVQQHIVEGRLSAAHGVALASLAGFPAVCSSVAKNAIERALSSKVLEGGIPNVYNLEAEGLARRTYEGTSNPPFDMAACPECQAYRKSGFDHVCLNPSCHDEKKAKADAASAAALAAHLAKLNLDPGTLPSIEDLRGRYEFLTESSPPTGCKGQGCEHWRYAIYYDKRPRLICTDPTCWKRLREAQTRAENADAKREEEAHLQRAQAAIDAIQSIGPTECAILAAIVLQASGIPKPIRRAALKRHGLKDVLSKDNYENVGTIHGRLAGKDHVAIVKALVEAAVLQELNLYHDQRMTRYGCPLTDSLLGEDHGPSQD